MIWVALGAAGAALFDKLGTRIDLLSVAIGAVFCFAVVASAYQFSRRGLQPTATHAFFDPREHQISAEGIRSTQRGARSLTQWERVPDVTASAEHIFIWIDTHMAYLIPVRDLPEGVTAEQLVTACKEWMAAPAAPEIALPPASSEAAPETSAVPPVIKAPEATLSPWRTVFRLFTLRLVEHTARPDSALSGRVSLIVLLALAALAIWVGLSWFYFLPDPHFYLYSAPALSWYVLAALTVALAMTQRAYPQIRFSQVCLLLAMLLPVLLLADFAIVKLVPERWIALVHVFLGLYALAYCSRGLRALTGRPQPMAVLGGFAVAVLFVWVAKTLYVYPAVWTSGDPQQYAEELAAADDESEALLFQQPLLISESAARIKPATGDAPAGFFVGFAGYGEQRVFAEEIKFAARQFADRYDTAGRTLLLINDRRDHQTRPLATVSGLSYALKEVASKMRLDEDVLFLALSSHGSEDPVLSVENGELPLHDLTGDALAEALTASGIKWRVIVISACHAGAFIEPLRDPYTVVITAASPDRTSFGCSDDRDLTYFGEAFFRDSLPQAASLREAFDTATRLVSEREAKEDFEASNPQAFFGEQIEPRIASMLRARAP